MPYIDKERRRLIDKQLGDLEKVIVSSSPTDQVRDTTVSYVIYKIIRDLYGNEDIHQVLIRAIGILEETKLTIYEFIGKPLEQHKLEQRFIEDG